MSKWPLPGCGYRAKDAAPGSIVLQLLCTNDTHSQMEPFRASTGSEKGSILGGVVARAAMFDAMRSAAECDASLTLDAGDLLVGTPYFDFLHGEADMVVMRELGYDAVAVGNHDFDGSAPSPPQPTASRAAAPGVSSDSSCGLGYLKNLATRFAPHLQILCGNVIEQATGEPVFAPHAVFERPGGVRIGVAAVLGRAAWEVIDVPKRHGLRLADFERCARSAAAALLEHNCDVLICLSHTGADRGDRELASLGLFDCIFSGHAHFYDRMDALEHFEGPGGRLGLLSPGFARGGGVSWLRLVLDGETRRIVAHTSGITPVTTAGCGERALIVKQVEEWRAVFEAKCRAPIGRVHADAELPLPEAREQLVTFSAVHSALSRAMLAELRLLVPELLPAGGSGTIVVCNRNSAAFGLCAGQLITLGDLLELRKYDSGLVYCEVSGEWLRLLLDRNAKFVGCADFLYFEGVSYTLRPCRGALPEEGFNKKQLDSGALQVVVGSPQVFGTALEDASWYSCVTSDYVLDTLLMDMTGRETGVRNEQGISVGEQTAVKGFLQRGELLK